MFTGTRAEYGLLRPLMQGIRDAERLELQVLVSGAHLSARYGETWREIVGDGFEIDARVEMPLDDDSAFGITRAMGVELEGLGEALLALAPDILVLLGDRYEMMAAAIAGMLANVPIAHLHGGEATEGLIDEAVRHAVTKMSHLHLVAAAPFADRVVQMGEYPDRVWVTGSPGIDELLSMDRLGREELAETLGMPLKPPVLVVTYHPVTLPGEDPAVAVDELLAGLATVNDATVVITRPNAEVGRQKVSDRLGAWVQKRPRAAVFDSLGRGRYASLVSLADAVVGNSSSGLIDAPALGTPTVNVGMRQDGRLRAESVIDCRVERGNIAAAIRQALSSDMQRLAEAVESPYGDGRAVPRIIEVLASANLDGILVKRFHDLGAP